MSSCYITISYHIISYLVFSYLFCWLVLHCIQFCSIQLYFKLIEFYLSYYRVLYLISMNDLWLVVAVCPSLCLSVYLFICMTNFHFFFSPLLFLIPCLSFIFFVFYFFMNLFLAHTHTRTFTRTLTYIWIYFPFYDWYILLQKTVGEDSHSSDCIISYLI